MFVHYFNALIFWQKEPTAKTIPPPVVQTSIVLDHTGTS